MDADILLDGQAIMTHRYGYTAFRAEIPAGDHEIAVHIRHLREKIEINPREPRYLKVVWGVGYKVEKQP